MSSNRDFTEFEVSEILCPKCGTARPVRRHLLLVLPTGNRYEYRCSVCGTPVGGKDDGDAGEYNALLRKSSQIVR